MKLRGTQVLVAVVALLLGAVVAMAQTDGSDGGNASGFRAFERADEDQYGTTPTTATGSATVTTPVGSATVGAAGEVAPPSSTPPTTSTAKDPNAPVNGAGGNGGVAGEDSNGGGRDGATKPASVEDDGGTAPANANGGDGAGGAAGAGGSGDGSSAGAELGSGGAIAFIGLSPARIDVFRQVREVTGPPAYLAEFYEPLYTKGVADLTDGTPFDGAESDTTKLRGFAEKLGRSAADGGALARKALPVLARTVQRGQVKPVSGFVLTHVEVPLEGTQDRLRNVFIRGFIDGLAGAKVPAVSPGKTLQVPVVGAELSTTKPSTIPWFKDHGVKTTVDDVDLSDGKRSLARALAGTLGHFGIKSTATDGKLADRPDPKLAPLQFRPSASYVAGDLGTSDGGLPDAVAVMVGLLLVAFVGQTVLLAARRGRRRRRDARA